MALGAALRVMFSELASVGLDPDAICAAAGVDLRVAADDALPLEMPDLSRILASAEAAAGDPLLGLRMAERAAGRGVLSYLARSQRTVGDGLRAFERFAASAWGVDGLVRVEPRGATTVVGFHFDAATPRHVVEYLVARTAISLRRSGAPPTEVRFRHAPAAAPAEYERVLGYSATFERLETGLWLHSDALGLPLRQANPDAADALAAGLARPRTSRVAPASARVLAAVGEALARGAPVGRERIARVLGMSGKTLARRLAVERRRFQDLVDEVRRVRARELVGETSRDLADVAARVGFADLASFGKAFRRWFGESPSAFRARGRARGR